MFRPDKHYEERCHIKNVILVNKYDTCSLALLLRETVAFFREVCFSQCLIWKMFKQKCCQILSRDKVCFIMKTNIFALLTPCKISLGETK